VISHVKLMAGLDIAETPAPSGRSDLPMPLGDRKSIFVSRRRRPRTARVSSILGLLGGLLAAGLRSASEGWQRIVRHNDESEDLLAINGMLRQLLSQNLSSEGGRLFAQCHAVQWLRDRMEFLAPLVQRFGTADIVWYTMRDETLRVAWQLDRRLELGQESFCSGAGEGKVAMSFRCNFIVWARE
jgi:hypothetical protein